MQFRKHFIILLCEQSTQHETVFQTSDILIKETVKNLCQKHVQKLCKDDDKLVQNLFEYYHKPLNKDNWKYNIGAMNGFLTFIQHLYNSFETNMSLDYDKAQFILATGLNFLDHFEPNIQIIGIRMFNILLSESNSRNASEYNMDQVILEDAEKLILKSNEVDFEKELWQCLLSCCSIGIVKYLPEKWSKFDDVFEKLIEKLAMTDDKTLSMLYLNYTTSFCVLGESELNVFKEFLEIDSFKEEIMTARAEFSKDVTHKWKFFEVIKTYRHEAPFSNLRIFRWIKKLIIVLQNESYKIGGNEMTVSTRVNVSFDRFFPGLFCLYKIISISRNFIFSIWLIFFLSQYKY